MSDPRTPIFDAAKAAGGRFRTQAAVDGFHAALDVIGVRRAPAAPPKAPTKKTLAGVIGVAAAALLTATLATWEGDENVGYRDIAGIATNCRGNTKDVVVGRFYSDEECAIINDAQALAHVEPVLTCTPSLKGHPHQLAAAGSLAYNIGATAYCNSTVDRRFDAGDWKGACDAILMWDKVGGKPVRGLQNRRQYERSLCLKNLPTKG
jgi:lysozyme